MINFPIYLTNMNRLSTTKKMVEDLFRLNPKADITIIDNASTYPPLLNWYKEIGKSVKIRKNDVNRGPWTFFYTGINTECRSTYYVYSDADLELNPEMPYNWQEIMFDVLSRYGRKASLALRMSDVPEGPLKEQIKNHQSICWYPTDEKDLYRAITDMTFSMDAKNKGYRFESMRMAGKFECRHLPWYLDVNHLSEEEAYYIEHLDGKYPEAKWSTYHKSLYTQAK